MEGREKADRGASFTEYAALIVLAVVILGALVTIGLPSRLRTGLSGEICRVFHSGSAKGCGSTGNRADPYKPSQPCTVSTSSSRYGGDIAFTFVDIGGGVTLAEQTDSQGHVTVTAVADTSAKATAGVGAGVEWGKAVNIGVDANANAGFTIRTGDSWTFDNQKQADDFTGEIKKEAYANEAEQAPVFGPAIVGFAYKHSPWKPKVRPPDVTRYSVAGDVTGNANGSANVGPGKKPSSSKGSPKGGKHAPGKHAPGKHAPDKRQSGESWARTAGKSGINVAQGGVKVTYGDEDTVAVDHKHHTYSVTADFHASATATGNAAGQSPDHPYGGSTDGSETLTTDAHGKLLSIDITQTQTVNGKTTVTTTHLPVTDADRAQIGHDAAKYGTVPPLPLHLTWDDLAPTTDPGAAGNDFQRDVYEHGQTTKVTYDTTSSDSPVGANFKAGVEFSLGGDHATQNQKVTGAQYLGPPGPDGKRHYQDWKECK